MPDKLPNIYHFNPTCEYAVANGSASWQPNSLLQKMETDLASLPAYFAKPSDFIVLDKKPAEKFVKLLSKLNFQFPKILSKNEIKNFQALNTEIDQLCPWGWSPAEHNFLRPLKAFCTDIFKQSPVFNWKPGHRNLYSRKFSLDILQKIVLEIDSEKMISNERTARICNSKQEIEELLDKWNKLMIKAPWSSSGRGLQAITKVPVHDKVWEKILGIIRVQGYVLAEPLLDKEFDLALQFKMTNGKISYQGQSNFLTDKKGQYQGNYLNGLPKELNPEIRTFVSAVPELIVTPLINILENSELALLYEGNFGVDTLIFRDANHTLKIYPCLEINVRQNMGLLSLQLEKLIQPGIHGTYLTYYNPQKPFSVFVQEMEHSFPPDISKQKIKKGFFPLTDFDINTKFGAYLIVK